MVARWRAAADACCSRVCSRTSAEYADEAKNVDCIPATAAVANARAFFRQRLIIGVRERLAVAAAVTTTAVAAATTAATAASKRVSVSNKATRAFFARAC